MSLNALLCSTSVFCMAHSYIYVSDTLNFDLKQAGFMSSLPYLVMAVIMQFAGGLADWLRNTERLTTTQVSPNIAYVNS